MINIGFAPIFIVFLFISYLYPGVYLRKNIYAINGKNQFERWTKYCHTISDDRRVFGLITGFIEHFNTHLVTTLYRSLLHTD
jgi:hypothetical protein